ncbi:MAG: hypothetical protein M2R46_04667 [Verrucomicrobia subdivision 3 bacterium]|nr:hypothetical protein [Limisphaerales bacterium]
MQNYIELGSGMYYWSNWSQTWRESRALLKGVGTSRRGGHKKLFVPDLTERVVGRHFDARGQAPQGGGLGPVVV